MIPQTGQIVHVRSRRYLVEGVVPRTDKGEDTLVRLACLDDDAQGQPLEVLWEREIDARPVTGIPWESVVAKGFDAPRWFSAFLHTVRWNCVTSTDAKLFQAPYRAGIEVKAYQLEPLRKALLLPRVNLFIADDVGLGKTIEAGLILRELLMRQKARRVVVAAPPSVVRQWQEEMEQRFGLTFVVYDREWVTTQRRERGYGINPWRTHTRFVISHALLRDEAYAAPLRDWLADEDAGAAILILDEAHNAAPASSQKYAIDSKLTKTIRDLAPLFEHRLFLSATPHNGHSNSFAALLELLDPQRFCRGVPVRDKKLLDQVMVRRLKQDLRAIGEDFPKRHIVPVVVDNLPAQAPELTLSALLQDYRQIREDRLANETKTTKAAGMLVLISLQKRLLSSIEAFARTLIVHQKTMLKLAATLPTVSAPRIVAANLDLLNYVVGSDDERAELPEESVAAEEDTQMEVASAQGGTPLQAELDLLQQMSMIANKARYASDPRILRLVAWIEANLCPNGHWNDRRVLIFTEYTDTKRYLEDKLLEALPNATHRIATFHGGIGEDRRAELKKAFNSDPTHHPLRILIATDAAREGVNLQNHCADLFHFDIPWNPGRMEQRNGRIDRKLQRAKEVRCHYFVLPQRAEDRVLDTLVRKTATIQVELGSLSPVITKTLDRMFEEGIRHERAVDLVDEIAKVDKHNTAQITTMKEELEEARPHNTALIKQLEELQGMLDRARKWIGLEDNHFREALSASLELLGTSGLSAIDATAAAQDPSTARYVLPDLSARFAADRSWTATLDTLRVPRKQTEKPVEWRRNAPIRPILFRDSGTLDGDAVHLHLEHRLVQRLLGRFLSQGFVYDELRRACVLLTDETTPAVVLLGRLSLYGDGAVRLHDEIVATAADWSAPEVRKGRLTALGERDKADVLALVERSLGTPRLQNVSEGIKERLQKNAALDVRELLPSLERRTHILAERAIRALTERGEREAADMETILSEQAARIAARITELEAPDIQQRFKFSMEEDRQVRSDLRHLKDRVKKIAVEHTTEPARIKTAYEVRARRLEPVGLVYLWPVSG